MRILQRSLGSTWNDCVSLATICIYLVDIHLSRTCFKIVVAVLPVLHTSATWSMSIVHVLTLLSLRPTIAKSLRAAARSRQRPSLWHAKSPLSMVAVGSSPVCFLCTNKWRFGRLSGNQMFRHSPFPKKHLSRPFLLVIPKITL